MGHARRATGGLVVGETRKEGREGEILAASGMVRYAQYGRNRYPFILQRR